MTPAAPTRRRSAILDDSRSDAMTAGRPPTERHVAEQAALRRVAEVVARGIEPQEMFPLVAAEVARLLDAEAGVVWQILGDDSVVTGVSGPHTARLGAAFPNAGDGAVAMVARSGLPARARYDDLARDDPTRVRVERHGYRFGVAAPVMVEGSLWGSLLAARVRGDDFPGDAEARLLSFAELIGVAIANADARTRLRRRIAEQEAFARIATSVAGSRPSAEVFTLVAEEVARLLDLEVGAVARFGDGVADVVAHWSVPELAPPQVGDLQRISLDQDSVLARVQRAGIPARVDDYRGLHGGLAAAVLALGLRSSAAAPVRVGGRTWGAVVATSPRANAIPADAEERLARLADLVGMAIASAAHRAELESRAATDPLTGLPNHRTFHERLGEEMARTLRHGRPFGVVVLDIDHFKRVNDGHGHHVGDAVLGEVARRLAAAARAGDMVARVGGEEFAWILPETAGIDAWQAADRARASIAAEPFEDVGSVTISAGVSDTTTARSTEELYQQADGALYWAKAHGRNVCLSHSGDSVSVLSGADQARRVERVHSIETIRALAAAVDAKTPGMRGHSGRVADLSVQLATALGWPIERAALLRDAGLVHDVGKLGVPDDVLRAPTRLDHRQHELIELHPVLGVQIAEGALEAEQLSWIRSHHERFDGRGYPEGLSGDRIPEGGRILALAEAWDAMRLPRGYAPARTQAEALAECRAMAGSQFSPDAVEALVQLADVGALAAP